jgi:hypothetical protein
MARRRKHRKGRGWCPRLGTAVAGLATLGVLAWPGPAEALPGVPSFTLSHSTGLIAGEEVVASWENQFVGLTEQVFVVHECAGHFDPSTYFDRCITLAYQYPAAPSGSYKVRLAQVFYPLDQQQNQHICKGNEAGEEQCYVELVAANTYVVKGSVPIHFGSASTK